LRRKSAQVRLGWRRTAMLNDARAGAERETHDMSLDCVPEPPRHAASQEAIRNVTIL
jgi:hypothetical protein